MIMKEVRLLESNGGSVEDLQGVYDIFATVKVNPQFHEISFDEIPDGLERLKRQEVIGRLVVVLNKSS